MSNKRKQLISHLLLPNHWWWQFHNSKFQLPFSVFWASKIYFVTRKHSQIGKTVNLTKISFWAVIQTSVQRETLELKTSRNSISNLLSTRVKSNPLFGYQENEEKKNHIFITVLSLSLSLLQKIHNNKKNKNKKQPRLTKLKHFMSFRQRTIFCILEP